MQTVIKADDGDLITIHADDLSIEQLTLRLELESPAYDGAGRGRGLTPEATAIPAFSRDRLSPRTRRESGDRHKLRTCNGPGSSPGQGIKCAPAGAR